MFQAETPARDSVFDRNDDHSSVEGSLELENGVQVCHKPTFCLLGGFMRKGHIKRIPTVHYFKIIRNSQFTFKVLLTEPFFMNFSLKLHCGKQEFYTIHGFGNVKAATLLVLKAT